jgi:hypothetical protein
VPYITTSLALGWWRSFLPDGCVLEQAAEDGRYAEEEVKFAAETIVFKLTKE